MNVGRGRALGILLVLVAIGACARGPTTATLRADLEERLETRFEPGLFTLTNFERMGSAPFTDLERDISGLFVYYDADLRFERDYNLTSWKGLNLGTLAFVAGATEVGVRGLGSGGNQAGDLLHIHGRLAYTKERGRWSEVAMDPPPETSPSRAPSVEGTGHESVLQSVRSLVSRDAPGKQGTRDDIIVRELRGALAAIDLAFAQQAGRHTLGTGQRLGTYHAFGQALADFATGKGQAFHAFPSDGSVENALMLHARELDFALIQSDVAQALYEGWSDDGQISLPRLRSVASLWPEAVHVVTLEGTGIEHFEQLAGRRVAIGRLGSGTRFTATRISAAFGLDRSSFAETVEESVEDSLADLEAGRLDAVILTEAVPSQSLQALVQKRSDVRLVAISDAVLDALSDEYFAYYPITVPARTYPGQTEAFRTLGLAAALVTHEATEAALVHQMLEYLLDGSEGLAQAYYRAGFISRDTARLGIAVPIHPAAERFYGPESAKDAPAASDDLGTEGSAS
jgi:TRAP transporter TAXI family solute receptor